MEMSSDWFLAETFCGSGECHKREVSLFKVGQIVFFCPHLKCEDLWGSFSEITFIYMLQTIRMNHCVSCKEFLLIVFFLLLEVHLLCMTSENIEDILLFG